MLLGGIYVRIAAELVCGGRVGLQSTCVPWEPRLFLQTPEAPGGPWEMSQNQLPVAGPESHQRFGSLRRRQRWDVRGWSRVGWEGPRA